MTDRIDFGNGLYRRLAGRARRGDEEQQDLRVTAREGPEVARQRQLQASDRLIRFGV
jgi:hypothetical protein